MSTTIYHRHHIIPRHAGGTDNPENIVLLTVEEHAEAHRLLWEEHGRIEDKIAWKMLSGKTSETEQDFIELYRKGGLSSKGRKHSEEAKRKMSEVKRSKNVKRPDLTEYNKREKTGKTIIWTEEDKKKKRESIKQFYQTPAGIERRKKQSERMKQNNPNKNSSLGHTRTYSI